MWLYNDQEYAEIGEGIGFVYLITNLRTNRKYIGKKNFYFSKTKQVKGKKKRVKVESDWKDYYGSNEELNHHVNIFGKDAFKREILRLCSSKGEMSYFEAKYQFENSVLESDNWYNSWISCKIHTKHLTFLKKHSMIKKMKKEVDNGPSTQEPPEKGQKKGRQSKAKGSPHEGKKEEVNSYAHAGS